MGADWQEINILDKPLLSPKDFTDRIQFFVDDVQKNGDSKHALVAHFAGVKEGCAKAGVDWNRVVVAPCQKYVCIDERKC